MAHFVPFCKYSRRTSASIISIGITTLTSVNTLNYNLRDSQVSTAMEKFNNSSIIKKYNLSQVYKLSEGWHDIQALGETNNNWKLDVKLAPPGTNVDDWDLCSGISIGTAETVEIDKGFIWQSYVNCSGANGFYGYGKNIDNGTNSIQMGYYTNHGNFLDAELWIK